MLRHTGLVARPVRVTAFDGDDDVTQNLGGTSKLLKQVRKGQRAYVVA